MGAQRFVGIRSGLTGDTIIVFPVYSRGELRVRRPGGGGVSPVLGRLHRASLWENYGVAILPGGTEVLCGPGGAEDTGSHISMLDAAMSVLQYLSDQGDPRLELEGYAGAGAVVGQAAAA